MFQLQLVANKTVCFFFSLHGENFLQFRIGRFCPVINGFLGKKGMDDLLWKHNYKYTSTLSSLFAFAVYGWFKLMTYTYTKNENMLASWKGSSLRRVPSYVNRWNVSRCHGQIASTFGHSPGSYVLWKWCKSLSRWWFQIFFMFTPTWGRFPIWLIFFKGVKTTN